MIGSRALAKVCLLHLRLGSLRTKDGALGKATRSWKHPGERSLGPRRCGRALRAEGCRVHTSSSSAVPALLPSPLLRAVPVPLPAPSPVPASSAPTPRGAGGLPPSQHPARAALTAGARVHLARRGSPRRGSPHRRRRCHSGPPPRPLSPRRPHHVPRRPGPGAAAPAPVPAAREEARPRRVARPAPPRRCARVQTPRPAPSALPGGCGRGGEGTARPWAGTWGPVARAAARRDSAGQVSSSSARPVLPLADASWALFRLNFCAGPAATGIRGCGLWNSCGIGTLLRTPPARRGFCAVQAGAVAPNPTCSPVQRRWRIVKAD